jgi:hypothetical protein
MTPARSWCGRRCSHNLCVAVCTVPSTRTRFRIPNPNCVSLTPDYNRFFRTRAVQSPVSFTLDYVIIFSCQYLRGEAVSIVTFSCLIYCYPRSISLTWNNVLMPANCVLTIPQDRSQSRSLESKFKYPCCLQFHYGDHSLHTCWRDSSP